jgi:hypothetical protein
MPAPISFGRPLGAFPFPAFICVTRGGTYFSFARLADWATALAPLERHERRSTVLGLAALILAAAANPTPALASTAPWWEKFTFTFSGDGAQQSCRYQTSMPTPAAAQACEADDDSSSPPRHEASAVNGTYTKITIERRYTPGLEPEPVKLETGDTLLGGQIMALAIDGNGAVKSCEVVGRSGEVQTPYGCENAKGERFQALSSRLPQLRHGYITVLVYGHDEYPV